MTIWNLGSINADHVYQVPHIPAPGETIAARAVTVGLGGKGANMSVAIARAAGHAAHIGAVGADGRWMVDRLTEYGVDTRYILTVEGVTGHAIITVGDDGENAIVLHPGANQRQNAEHVFQCLTSAKPGDFFLCQNETSLQYDAMCRAKERGLSLAYAAAPFDVGITQKLAPMLDYLFLNEVEAEQFEAATGAQIGKAGPQNVIVTRGARDTLWYLRGTSKVQRFAAQQVDVVDTTGAGDTFTGFVLAGLDRGLPIAQAISQAMRAAAIKVTRAGAADAIPDLADVQAAMQSG